MPDPTPKSPRPDTRFVWVVGVMSAAVVVMAVASYGGSGEATAAPGAPLYDHTVQEAIRGLKGLRTRSAPVAAAKRPALPAGLDPKDYYWCEKCKAYHLRKPQTPAKAGATPGQAAHSHSVPPQAAKEPAAIPPSKTAPSPGAGNASATRPPLPTGLDPKDYYWCEKCKAYHPRKPQAAGKSPASPAGQ